MTMFTDWPLLLKMQRTNISFFVPGTYFFSNSICHYRCTLVGRTWQYFIYPMCSFSFSTWAFTFILLFFVLAINYNGWFAKELLIKILHHFYFAFCVCVQQPDSTSFVFSFAFLLKSYLTFVPVFCYFYLSILIFIDCLLFTFIKKSRSWAKGLQWCGTFLKVTEQL